MFQSYDLRHRYVTSISMHVTVDDVIFCEGLECVYVKYKSRASTARELPGFASKNLVVDILCNNSGLQIFGKRYDVDNNVAYIMAKL